MKKRFFTVLIAALLTVSAMPAANAFDIIYDLPPISAKLSEGNKTVTVTFETAPSSGEYITVYSEWDAFKINEPLTVQTITNHDPVQVIKLDKPALANVFVSYAPLHTSEGGQIESRVIESTGYTSSRQDSPADSSREKLTTDFKCLPIYDALGNTYALGDTSGEATVLVIGRANCSLTTGKLRNVRNLLDRLKIKDAEIYLLDIDNAKETVSVYAEQNPDIHVAWHNNSQDYNRLFWEIQRATSSVSGSGSAVLPSLCILDRSLQPVYYGAGIGIDLSEIESALSPYSAWQSSESAEERDDPGSGTYSRQDVTITLIPPGANSPASNTIPEKIPVEELHTDFSKLPVYDVISGEYPLGSAEADLSILVIGNSLCSYTIKRIQFLKDMLESLNVAHTKLYLLDMGKKVGNERADAERFAEKNPGVFVARAADNSDIYYRLFFEVCHTRGKPGGRFPAICVLDDNCIPIYTTTEILFDENELSGVLQPYAAEPYDNAAAAEETPVSPENSAKDIQAHASGVPFLDVQSKQTIMMR